MKKLLLLLTSFTIASAGSLNAISCTTRDVGWQAKQDYWMVINYDQFFQWMSQVDLVSQENWNAFDNDKKEESWKTLTNVDLNNFMTVINLAYKYLFRFKDEKADIAPQIAVDEVGGFYHDFAYAILDNENSFAHRIQNLNYKDEEGEIIVNHWDPLKFCLYMSDFKDSNLGNQFKFVNKDHQEKEPLSIKMTVTSDNGMTLPREKIVEYWKEIAEKIENPIDHDSSTIEGLWSNLKTKMFESFIFKINFYLPTDTESASLKTTFNFRLTFDF